MAVEIGRRLRFLREQRGISLDQIANHTLIDRRYLIALENGQFHVFPSEFHVKSCLRAYAKCIGVNPQRLLQAYTVSSGLTQPKVATGNMRSVLEQTQPRLPMQNRRNSQFLGQNEEEYYEEEYYAEEGSAEEFVEEEEGMKEVPSTRKRSGKAKKGRAGSLFNRFLLLLAILLLICGGIVFYLRMSTDEVSLDSQSGIWAGKWAEEMNVNL